jgi:uncharacterized protein YdiU (UPF0061 family)
MTQFTLENRYPDALPATGYHVCQPAAAPDPALLLVNEGLAETLGIASHCLNDAEAPARWTGNVPLAGARPVALAYAGHQFGQPVPQLGDGRAVILGQVTDCNGRPRDLQLKGSGRTPFARAGDGLAALSPVLREYVVSEAMHALGVPTTRALTAASTGATLERQFGPEPGAVLTRVAASHLRFGSFEYFAHRRDTDGLQTLVDLAIDWHDPDWRDADARERAAALLDRVVERTARLISEWLRVGFIHGVMNTDNMTLSGETLDYGPCAFMDGFRPDRVYSSIDVRGRYAWNQQPRIAHWNLARLAECLLPLLDEDEAGATQRAEDILARYPTRFEQHYNRGLAAKLGLADRRDTDTPAAEADGELGERFLGLMARHEADFTNTWRALAVAAPDDPAQRRHMAGWLGDDPALTQWLSDYSQRLQAAGIDETTRAARMNRANPAVIPRNHQVESALEAARQGDLQPTRALLDALAHPYQPPASALWLQRPPSRAEVVPATFCGT